MYIYLRPISVTANGMRYVEPNHLVIDLIHDIDRDERGTYWYAEASMLQLMYIKSPRGTAVYLDSWKTWEEQGVGEGCIVFRIKIGQDWRLRPASAA
jgi:hypothetical protein